MPPKLSKPFQTYYDRLASIRAQKVSHETALRGAFQTLLESTCPRDWTLVPEQQVEGKPRRIVPDGTFRDEYRFTRGHWEAKDTADDLDVEIQKKFALGYPNKNILFENTERIVLYQNGARTDEGDMRDPAALKRVLDIFYRYSEPNIEGFEQAVDSFKETIPELAEGLKERIEDAHKTNPAFKTAFADFYELCKTALNPNIRVDAVDEMLIQHLLTERLMRTVFDNEEFVSRNVIAAEIEKVIKALTSRSFNRREFLGKLDHFYSAIEAAAGDMPSFADKQTFLNTVYERFFQGYSVKVADTHGIVYTPQPIVDFMCASVDEALKTELGKPGGLSDPDVVVIDPATGTGNFIVNLLRRVPRTQLGDFYRTRLFANEVMLLPYYIASLNIEHAYYEQTGQYETFEGVCFVDTLDMAESGQMKMSFLTEANSARVERQKKAPITVIIGNPPYNVGQLDENDNNKNRKYEVIDRKIAQTYAKDSQATLLMQIYDPYVKFFRWATERLGGRDGIVCYVTNNSFVDNKGFDSMRKHLLQDFTRVYHLDLHGNVRQNPKLSGTTHNVFGIQVGVGITIAIRSAAHTEHKLYYHRVPEDWRKTEKLKWLADRGVAGKVEWQELIPDIHHTWIVTQNSLTFNSLLEMGSKEAKQARSSRVVDTIFKTYSTGISTSRDTVVYDFNAAKLLSRMKQFSESYNSEIDRYKRENSPSDVDAFVNYDRVKWSRNLKRHFRNYDYLKLDSASIRPALYRPFSRKFIYFADIAVDELGQCNHIFPTSFEEKENKVICITNHSQTPFVVQMTNAIPSLDVGGRPGQCFPFYVYDEDGTNRRENITDWALAQFQAHYTDPSITKWDIFYYVYAALHNPAYREKFAANLKRDLPRIPYYAGFRAYAEVGKALADLHLNYETLTPYPLESVETPNMPLDWRVEKMRLSPDKSALRVNAFLTLKGIPPEAFQYRLGNRSALDWVIDQYQVDAKTGSDPNRADDPEYIVRLVGQVVRVSMETVRLVEGLPHP